MNRTTAPSAGEERRGEETTGEQKRGEEKRGEPTFANITTGESLALVVWCFALYRFDGCSLSILHMYFLLFT